MVSHPHNGIELSKINFRRKVISLKADFEWLPHRTGLNPSDHFLWGNLKGRVYKSIPQSIAELKDAIEQEIVEIFAQGHKKVMDAFLLCLEPCMGQNKGHLELLM